MSDPFVGLERDGDLTFEKLKTKKRGKVERCRVYGYTRTIFPGATITTYRVYLYFHIYNYVHTHKPSYHLGTSYYIRSTIGLTEFVSS